MEFLERLGEIAGNIGNGIASAIERLITGLFGSSNARYIRRLQPKVAAINALEPKYQAMSDAELRDQTAQFRKRLAAGETLDDLLVDAFAVCREGGRRFLNMRHYDVQLMGGMVLHAGNIAEMVTGEGKTLVATLPAYLNALEGRGVHVVTVNDYLARRDMEWMGPLYLGLGLTVGAIQANMPVLERQKAYSCDITYGTNNEFGFDYLRDNMKPAARGDRRYPFEAQQAQGPLNFAIIDEVDNILVDEARTPLIISGPAHDDVAKYTRADRIARQLQRDVHFEVKEKERSAHLTEAGVRAAEKLAGVESFYTAGNMEWPHLIDNSLKAHHLHKRDVNYVVQNGEVVIVDEFTGRLMVGRQWSDGLHQAVEAKEGVRVKEESQTLATITLQNFFKLYKKISGMTGTAMTEANEFWKIYKLDVIAIPTNRSLQRVNHPDVIFRSEREKYQAIVDEIERLHKWDVLELSGKEASVEGHIKSESDGEIEIQVKESKDSRRVSKSQIKQVHRRGRPILLGTVSIENSEKLSGMLDRVGVQHEVLNAKHHQREAEIIAQAGRKNAVTIATNMAGRGTDIILGGNPDSMAWAQLQSKYKTRLDVPPEEWNALVTEIEQRENMKAEGREVATLGGLHVIGTERHEARRIDLQLRGRCGRQGDPGSSRFFLSLEDDLMRIFAGEWVRNVLTRLGMQEGEAIESRMVTRRIEGAQKKVEERNFDIRKNLLEYDEVMDEQRKRVYGYRQRILDGADGKQLILDMIRQQIGENLGQILDKDYGSATFAGWASTQFAVEFEPTQFRGMDYASAEQYAKDEAERMAESQLLDSVDENLPQEDDPEEWNWEALAKFLNTRWNVNVRDRDLRKLGRNELVEPMLEKVRVAIREIDCSSAAKFLDPDFPAKTATDWLQLKFGIPLDVEEVRDLDSAAFQELALRRAAERYDEKETELPVHTGLVNFSTQDSSGQKRYDKEALIHWAKDRFQADLDVEELKAKSREELHEVLVELSRKHHEQAKSILDEAEQKVATLFEGQPATATAAQVTGGNGPLDSLATWLERELQTPVPKDELAQLPRDEFSKHVTAAVVEHSRPEMHRLERHLLLHVLDQAWKDHLLAMDHLRNSVGLRGYAQVDPKVEYKREGMRLFDRMWVTVGERVSDLIFRMEQLDERFLGSMWVRGREVHDSPPQVSGPAGEEQQINDGAGQAKVEPIRNRTARVGRNDPCPCGSGKKFKNCHMKAGG